MRHGIAPWLRSQLRTRVSQTCARRPALVAFVMALASCLLSTSYAAAPLAQMALLRIAVSAQNPSSFPQQLTVLGDRLAFTADDGMHGRELWQCDRSGRVTLIADLIPGPGGSAPEHLRTIGDCVYFNAPNGVARSEMWVWNPAGESPQRVVSSDPGVDALAAPTLIGIWAGLFCFVSSPYYIGGGGGPLQVWTAPVGGSEATTVTVRGVDNLQDVTRAGTVIADGALVFGAAAGLWRSDNPAEGAYRIADVALDARFGNLVRLEANAVFAGEGPDDACGRELWVTDGTPGGTRLLRDIFPGRTASGIADLTPCGNVVYFKADDGQHGLELWVTDGTPDGTGLVRDVDPGTAPSDPHYLTPVGDRLYFVADDGAHGFEIWYVDAEADEPVLVCDLYTGVRGSDPWSLSAFGSNLAFCASSPVYGEEVWLSDGTVQGTRILRDIRPGIGPEGPDSSGPDNLVEFNGMIYFTCDDGIHGEELWKSDGTEINTTLAADICPIRYNPSSYPRQLTAVGQTLYFVAHDRDHGDEVWTSDGSEEGTSLLRDIAEGSGDSRPRGLTPLGDRLVFTADDRVSGRELWLSDGTSAGTVSIGDIFPGASGSDPNILFANSTQVYFIANDGVHGRELWSTSGAAEDVVLVEDATPGPQGSTVVRVFELNQTIYFYTVELDTQATLWRVAPDGRSAQQVWRLADMDRVWDPYRLPAVEITPGLPGASEASQASLDPQTAYLIQALHPCTAGLDPAPAPVTLGATAFFVANTEQYGAELWKTDGTRAGTGLVIDAYPGAPSSSPTYLTPFTGNILYFVADSPREGRVLWRTDGSPHGTFVVNPLVDSDATELWGAIHPAGPLLAIETALVMTAPRPIGGAAGKNVIGVLWHLPDEQPSYTPLEDVRTGSADVVTPPHGLMRVGSRLFFTLDDSVHGEELWVTDLTFDPSGVESRLVKDILRPGDLAPLRR